MLPALAILLAGLTLIAPPQDAVHFERHLKVGDTATYELDFSGDSPAGDLSVTEISSHKVLSIGSDGGAAVQYTLLSRKVLFNSAPFNTKLDPPFTRQVDRNGVPIDGKDFDRNDFSRYLDVLFLHDVKVGDVLKIDRA